MGYWDDEDYDDCEMYERGPRPTNMIMSLIGLLILAGIIILILWLLGSLVSCGSHSPFAFKSGINGTRTGTTA